MQDTTIQAFHERAQQIANDSQLFFYASQRIKELTKFIDDLKLHLFIEKMPRQLQNHEVDAITNAIKMNWIGLSDTGKICYKPNPFGFDRLNNQVDILQALDHMVERVGASESTIKPMSNSDIQKQVDRMGR
jgi:hypothetical protein